MAESVVASVGYRGRMDCLGCKIDGVKRYDKVDAEFYFMSLLVTIWVAFHTCSSSSLRLIYW